MHRKPHTTSPSAPPTAAGPTSDVVDRPMARWTRVRRAATLVVSILLVAGISGAGFQAYATARDERHHPAPGELVSVDGHTLHLQVEGTNHTGGPTVILESGMGPAFSSAWAHIQRDIAQYARVVSYDRPGLGWSEPHQHGQDPEALAQDLHSALTDLGIDGPYLLVAHSLGAFHSRVFAATFPDQVTGMVLLDPSHEDQWDRLPQSVLNAQGTYNRTLQALPLMARVGLTRAVDPFGPLIDHLPADVRAAAASRAHRPTHLATTWDERRQYDAMGDVARRVGSDLGDLPVWFISSGQEPDLPEIVEGRKQLHREQAMTISDNTQVLVIDANHVDLVARAEPAAQVATVIEELWNDVAR